MTLVQATCRAEVGSCEGPKAEERGRRRLSVSDCSLLCFTSYMLRSFCSRIARSRYCTTAIMASTDSITLPSPFDAHVHLRQGSLMKLVVPHVQQGGINLAFVMPNLIPPLLTPSSSISYLRELEALAPGVKFLPSMYLSDKLTPEMIREAKKGGVVGVKSYPRGVTTNSEGGVGMEGYAVFDDVFRAMEEEDMVLNLHGEVPSDVDGDVS